MSTALDVDLDLLLTLDESKPCEWDACTEGQDQCDTPAEWRLSLKHMAITTCPNVLAMLFCPTHAEYFVKFAIAAASGEGSFCMECMADINLPTEIVVSISALN